jgi:DNA-binding transcriptional ArsR family regulator
MDPETVTACKTLMDRDRLRIVGALAGADATAEELASALKVPSRGTAKHLARLREAGLVTQVAGTGGVRYSLDIGRLARTAAELARFEETQQPTTSDLPSFGEGAPDGGWSQDDTKVLRAFIEDGRLTSIPAQHAKRMVVLRFLAATAFVPGEEYPEKEVNMRLALRHPDVAALRRYLVDEGFMTRASGIYRLTATERR